MHRIALAAGLLVLSSVLFAGTDSANFRAGIAALQRSDWPAAEQSFAAELRQFPTEPEALSLLGVAQDNQRRFPEAEVNHKAAVANAPRSTPILRNYGNHLLFAGDGRAAREVFLKVVAIDPADDYANMQLAQLAVKAKNGAEALRYLERLPAKQLEAPNVAIFRLAALDLTGDRAAASPLFNRLAAASENNAGLSIVLSRTLVESGQFEQAETFLAHALATDPTNFTFQYQLAAIASGAGHYQRSREVFEMALRQQPQNVDVLYGLAWAYHALNQSEQSVRLLAQAARLAPQRADVQKLLAVTAADIKAFEDSVAAWDRYVALAPDDDAGRRERGFAKVHIKQPSGMADLEWYAARHPDDALGLYELGASQAVDDPEAAMATLNKALALQPDFPEARSARGDLFYQQGKAEAALADLEFAAAKEPDDAIVLDRLGQTYLLVDRVQDALRVLRRAAELAPTDPKTQLHVANALGAAGQTAESRVFMQRYKELGGGGNVMARGAINYLSMTPEQQHADYRARVEKGVREHPDDVATQVLYLKLSIADGQMDQAAKTAREISALKPGAAVLADAGRALLTAKQYPLAKQLLSEADAASPTAGIHLELGIAAFHTDGLEAGMKHLDRVPESARGGDYYLAKAQMLDSAGKPEEAIAAMQQGVRAEPAREDLYWQASVLLAANKRAPDALRLLLDAQKLLPENSRIPVLYAAVLEWSGKSSDALAALADAQHRWPEAAAVWAAQGMIQESHRHFDDARKSLNTAIALGAHSAEVHAALAALTAAAKTNADASLPDASALEQLLRMKPPTDW